MRGWFLHPTVWQSLAGQASRVESLLGARARGAFAALALLLVACAGGASAPASVAAARAEPTHSSESAIPAAKAGGNASAPASVEPAPQHAGPAPRAFTAEACGPFECRRFATGSEALAALLDSVPPERPLALGIGEAHALAGSDGMASTARRFADELLPVLAGRATHLVVELSSPDPGCETAAREVRKKQEPVTAPQSPRNQNDYLELGRRARALGIEPFVLSPSCDELRAIAEAGDAAIDMMLQTIARVTSRMLRGALAKNHAAGRSGLVIGYGGALHNDVAPSATKASWSYGPDLAAFTRGRYVELDLIVREFIKDTEAWRALPWYAHFDPGPFADQWLLMRTGAQRFVLFFPRAASSHTGASTFPVSSHADAPAAAGSGSR